MKRSLLFCISFLGIHLFLSAQPKPQHNLAFDSLASRWDDGIPLGNGWLGALIWKKDNHVRLSLDRVDLWDDRPMSSIDKLKFNWIINQVNKGEYDTVQKLSDEPYENNPAPTKIPGAAIEFDLNSFGKVVSNALDIETALSVVKFENGVAFNNYIHATKDVGYFGFENLPADFSLNDILPILIPPNYNSGNAGVTGNSVEGQGLERLGYKKGTITKTKNSILYRQPTWNGSYYEVLIKWQQLSPTNVVGQWTITKNRHAVLSDLNKSVKEPTGWDAHIAWWNDFWKRSSVTLPDALVERQYYLELYKFGCVARSNTPPISLQAVWTADNGNLPPWKGDIHNDLNTQLSYWPGYTSNHLDLTSSYTNWMVKVKEENKRWTKEFYGVNGLNTPGVTTISGKPMGGWAQYSFSPTTVAWLAQHMYWQWKYSMDSNFLKRKALPYFNDVQQYFSFLLNKDGYKNKLPLSSSPEYNDNTIKAWFKDFTNYDLALIKSFYEEGIDMNVGNKNAWVQQLHALPAFDQNETGLTIAPGQNLEHSHRHHAHLMAIYPLALLNAEKKDDKEIMNKSLRWLESKGSSEWCGYSFSWLACIYARANEADSAVKQLQIFASNFCSINSFHLNGDQKGGQYSNFTYRPFTLEGNFGFAQGVHELLIQTRDNCIEIFPAVPQSWKNVSFNNLRTEGAFLISAKKENGVITSVSIKAEKGGNCKIKLPFKTFVEKGIKRADIKIGNDNIISFKANPGQIITFENGYE
ncbi:MAG: glycoside hydrolase N-terminal domain-containing protein [Chitinophagaceae bacterium]